MRAWLNRPRLAALPAGFGNLNALVEAQLSFNQLRSPLPAGLGGLKRLKVLDIRDNDAVSGLPMTPNLAHTLSPSPNPSS